MVAVKAYSRRLRALWLNKNDGKGVTVDFRIAVCEIRKTAWQSPAYYHAEGVFRRMIRVGFHGKHF